MAVDTLALKHTIKPAYSKEELRAIWRAKAENINGALHEFEQGLTEISTMPFKAIIELTQNCNFRCLMCNQSWEEKFQRYDPQLNMSMETFVKIADQLFPLATFVDLRGFGETTILPHWPEVVDYLERFPMIEWHLVTNLSLPRDDTWDKMIRLGFQLGFSCDGATKETFEAIRTRSRFERIVHNLEVVSDAIKRYDNGWLYFISTVQKKNLHELRMLVELAHRYRVPEVQFKIVQGDLNHNQGIRDEDPETIRANVSQAIDAALDLGVRVTFNDWLFTRDIDPMKVRRAELLRTVPKMALFSIPEAVDHKYWNEHEMNVVWKKVIDTARVSVNKRCFKPFSFAYINYRAEMGTCNHMMHPGMLVMGDLHERKIAEVWNSEAYREFRRQLVTAQPKDVRCQWCFKHRIDD